MPPLAQTTKNPDAKDVHIGKRLRDLRTSRGLSQTALGKNSNISFQQIQKYECGSNRIAGSRLAEFAEFFCVSASYFFVGLDEYASTHALTDPNEIQLIASFRAIRPNVQASILRIAHEAAQVSA